MRTFVADRYGYNPFMHSDIQQRVKQLSAALLRKQQKVCTAESCTGGLIAKTFTDLAGSSDWFDRGFVTYSKPPRARCWACRPR